MNRSKKLQPVVELARRETEQEAITLARINQSLRHEQQQLTDLNHYRQEYLQRFRGTDPLVMPARKALELRSFLAQLDQAIVLQEKQVQQVNQQAQLQQKQWQQARSKELAMQSLMDRYQQQEQLQQQRQEQRTSDQFSAQLWRRKAR